MEKQKGRFRLTESLRKVLWEMAPILLQEDVVNRVALSFHFLRGPSSESCTVAKMYAKETVKRKRQPAAAASSMLSVVMLWMACVLDLEVGRSFLNSVNVTRQPKLR